MTNMICKLYLKGNNWYHGIPKTQLVGGIKYLYFGSDIGPVKCDIASENNQEAQRKVLWFTSPEYSDLKKNRHEAGRTKDLNREFKLRQKLKIATQVK